KRRPPTIATTTIRHTGAAISGRDVSNLTTYSAVLLIAAFGSSNTSTTRSENDFGSVVVFVAFTTRSFQLTTCISAPTAWLLISNSVLCDQVRIGTTRFPSGEGLFISRNKSHRRGD